MNEIIFLVEEAPEGGYTARALGYSIFTEASSTQAELMMPVLPINRTFIDLPPKP